MINESTSPPQNMQERASFWHHPITTWQASGQTKAAYCKTHDLVYHQMLYWAKHHESESQSSSDHRHTPESAFVPVAVTDSQGLSLILPNGVEIRGITPQSMDCVIQLVRQL